MGHQWDVTYFLLHGDERGEGEERRGEERERGGRGEEGEKDVLKACSMAIW